ncbi:hypothetical protein [Phaeobacter gallaeciensis]|uniref:hypothetical protein n=1 Tax=Phaeobacter gallaeciensis TaxID=60890 RepID=UPI0003F84A03|nr:hypothetical protein [Phaeobacter gallaeciensis]
MDWVLIANNLSQVFGKIVNTATAERAAQNHQLTITGSIAEIAERLCGVRSDWWCRCGHEAHNTKRTKKEQYI